MAEDAEESRILDRKYVSVFYHHVAYDSLKDGACAGKAGGADLEHVHTVKSPKKTEGSAAEDIPDYLLLTSLSVLICVPLGALGVLDSLEVRRALQTSDWSKARQASDDALQKALSAIFVGPLIFLFIFLYPYILYHST